MFWTNADVLGYTSVHTTPNKKHIRTQPCHFSTSPTTSFNATTKTGLLWLFRLYFSYKGKQFCCLNTRMHKILHIFTPLMCWFNVCTAGTDPATDLRGTGFLGLMHMLYFVMDPETLPLARDIYKLSQHPTQVSPGLKRAEGLMNAGFI